VVTLIVIIVVVLVFLWPGSVRKLEAYARRRLPRLHFLTTHTIQRFRADLEKRYPTRPKPLP
jgi:hypothetical protein